MIPDDLHEGRTGDLVEIPGGGWAFVPRPLPPEIPYDDALIMALSRADAALGELSGLGHDVPNPQLLIYPAMRQEAVFSSRIEGTTTSLNELFRDEVTSPTLPTADQQRSREAADVREVRNYLAALEHGITRLPSDGITLSLVREMHAILLHGVRGDAATPGAFREKQIFVGTGTSITYVPPPPQAMRQALNDWETYICSTAACPGLMQCALQHVQFETIHPFLDGNGRMGRLLITLFLMKRGRLSQPLLYLSAYLESHRREYYRLLQLVRTHGAWYDWLLFFLEGIEETAQAATQRARRLLALRETLQAHVLDIDPKAQPLVDALITNPYLTVKRASEVLQVSLNTARNYVQKLERDGILVEITGQAWGRMYGATAVLEILNSVVRDVLAEG